jgi:uncharacterized protein (TIGR02594 family)
MTIFQIQHALAARNFDPGNIDGIWGRRTAAAVRAFQTAKGLLVDGVVGPKTLAALGLDDAPAKDAFQDPALPWLQEAQRLIGVREAPGEADNPDLIKWAVDLDIDYPDDQIAWCGLFVAHCIGSTLGAEPLPANPLGARSWLKFGAPCKPQPGAVMVFWRVSRNGWQGHVGFYAGENASKGYLILGGNQSDSVSYAWLSTDRLLDARWPATAPAGSGKPRKVANDGKPVSDNEA